MSLPEYPTVLVADDNADTRHVLEHMLAALGCAMVEAADGAAAVEVAHRTCPDLILLDLNMPELDGLAAASQIRADCSAAGHDVRIVAVTAFDTYGMKEAAHEAGCDGYVVKPLDYVRLDQILRQFLPIYCARHALR
jgi:CheY-like chemotaxis protein